MKYEVTIGDVSKLIHINDETSQFKIEGPAESESDFSFEKIDSTRDKLIINNNVYTIGNKTFKDGIVEFTLNGKWVKANLKDEQMLLLDRLGFKTGSKSTEGILNAPMPGKVVSFLVNEGDTVQAGDALVILEAMKMENELKSPATGIIKKLNASPGQSVEKNHTLLEIEPIG
ncbi:MAG: biotin/lipoyl-binding protein [Balneolales bacterium]|nr:biotin/lipoyl-binding protein [Balneolales bacterium]